MNDLDTLRPEVREAVEYLDAGGTAWIAKGSWVCIRAELLRLADDCARLVDCINAQPPTRRSLIDRAERAEAELAESRETIKRLNRRVQVAEAGVAEKVKASGGSLGRALANAAASKAEGELAALKNENAQLRDVLADRDMDREMAAHANKELAAIKARIDGSRHAFLGPNMDRITFLAEDIGPVGKYALVKVED